MTTRPKNRRDTQIVVHRSEPPGPQRINAIGLLRRDGKRLEVFVPPMNLQPGDVVTLTIDVSTEFFSDSPAST